MNILIVNRMMGVAWGGGENFDFQLARGLESQGHRVTFLTAEGEAVRQDVEMETVRTPYLRRYMYELAGRVRLLPGLIAEFDLRLFEREAAGALPEIVKRRAIDIVQILALPRLAARLERGSLPVAMRFPGPPAWFHSGLLRRLAASGVGLFAHGDTVGRLGALGVAAQEIPPGIDFDLYGRPDADDRQRLRHRIGASARSLVLVSVARMVPGKGHEFLLNAMTRLGMRVPGIHLILVGDGPLRNQFERLCQELGLGSVVTFAGQQTPRQVSQWLSAADLFCLFSEDEN